MNRRGFLRGLGLLIGSAAIPKEVLPVVEFIEKKSFPDSVLKVKTCKPSLYLNHMTIQRRTVSITGNGQSEVLWYNFDNCPNWPAYKEYMTEQERKIWFNER